MKKLFCLLVCAVLIGGCSSDPDPLPPVPPPDPEPQNDLSAAGTANCYLVHEAGTWSFDATVMGNGVSTERAAAARLAPSKASIVWQDAPDLLREVELREGRVYFTSGDVHGNALVTVEDDAGKILWSWHIWVTDYDPFADAPKLNGYSWMTRNLGALTDDFDDPGTVKGMVYQWGRKDPFPTPEGWTDRGPITVYDAAGAVTECFASEEVAVADNLSNAVGHPTTYYSGKSNDGDFNYDWLATDASGRNNLLWETQADGGKTLFDPCPPGWRVPRGDSWRGVNESNFVWDDVALGRRHPLLGYYPAVGNRGSATGEWTSTGGIGQYWSSTAANGAYVSTFYFLPSYLDTHGNENRSSGLPVRCVSETAGDPVVPPVVEEFVMNRVTEASYIAFAGQDVSGNYYIGVSNVPVEIGENGEQMPTEPGMIMYFDLYGANSEDADQAVLPEDTYFLRAEQTSSSADTQFTWAREMTPDGEIVYRRPVDGKVSVEHTENGYSIVGTFYMGGDDDFVVRYEGPLEFTNRTEGPLVPTIRDPVNVTFEEVSATWHYTDKDSERYTVRLLNGRVEEDELIEGCQVIVDLLSKPGSTKEKMVIEPGVYTPSDDYVSPMTFNKGALLNMMGVPWFSGTYCNVEDGGIVLVGFASEGTIEVKRSDDRYEFIVDATTPEGVSIKGTYPMNGVEFIDKSPAVPAGDWLSILREDKTVIFDEADASECRVWTYRDYYEGATEFEIMVDNNTTDEAFQLDVLAPEGATSIAGTYTTPKDPENPTVGEFIPGYKQFAVKKATWPYLYYDFDTSNYIGAPGVDGTIEIKELEDGRVEIQYAIKDDAQPANMIRAIWSGPVRWID